MTPPPTVPPAQPAAPARPLPRWAIGLGAVAALVLLNVALQATYFRLDLTADGRYTLSPVTRQTLDSIRGQVGPVTLRLYTEGELPPTVRRFQQAVRTHADELQAYAGAALRVVVADPATDTAARRRLAQRGLMPLPIRVSEGELARREVLFYPYVQVQYGAAEAWIDLMKGTAAERDLALLLKAEAELEYKFTAAIRRLVVARQPTVGILQGHGEYTPQQMPELMGLLQPHYRLATVDLARVPALLPATDTTPGPAARLDALLIAQPDTRVPEAHKYLIDQFLLRGGRILWLIDNQRIPEADLIERGTALTSLRQTELDDLFFRYGVKVNYDLVQDALCGYIDAIRTVGGRDVTSQERWLYFPLVRSFAPHPVTKNLDAVLLRFASSLDTLPVPGVRVQPILAASALSRPQSGTLMIDFVRTLTVPPPAEVFRGRGGRLLGLSLEGPMPSLFAGRERPADVPAGPQAPPRLDSAQAPARQVILADGALALGNHSRAGGRGLPADNGTLLLNALDWLGGDHALLDIRAREVSLRTLDRRRVLGHEALYRALNLALPVLLLLGVGLLRAWQRRRRYGQPA